MPTEQIKYAVYRLGITELEKFTEFWGDNCCDAISPESNWIDQKTRVIEVVKQKQQDSYPFRPPLELRERLERSARDNKRSLNAEIVVRLEASLSPSEPSQLEIANNQMLKRLCCKLGVAIEE